MDKWLWLRHTVSSGQVTVTQTVCQRRTSDCDSDTLSAVDKWLWLRHCQWWTSNCDSDTLSAVDKWLWLRHSVSGGQVTVTQTLSAVDKWLWLRHSVSVIHQCVIHHFDIEQFKKYNHVECTSISSVMYVNLKNFFSICQQVIPSQLLGGLTPTDVRLTLSELLIAIKVIVKFLPVDWYSLLKYIIICFPWPDKHKITMVSSLNGPCIVCGGKTPYIIYYYFKSSLCFHSAIIMTQLLLFTAAVLGPVFAWRCDGPVMTQLLLFTAAV